MRIWSGTSGFQYPEWKGRFYPGELSTAKMLRYYAAVFNSTEVNYTFRSLPSAKTIGRWDDETPEAFRFSFKAPQRVTHFAKLMKCEEVMARFAEAIHGMGLKQGPVLFQLPPTFKANASLLHDFLQSLPKNMRVAFEFRHESWFAAKVFETLADAGAALCIAESEEIETPKEVTAGFGYLRLRRIDYRPADIKAWARFLEKQRKSWAEAFVYFKHEETCVGPGFAQELKRIMASSD